MVSGRTTNSRVRVPSPVGESAPSQISVRSVCVDALRPDAGEGLGGLRTTLR
jgi:hypothetical protein